jgi:hypothetical protein
MISVTIQELSGTTDAIVRRAGASDTPTYVTDGGRVIAIIGNTTLLPPRLSRPQRGVFPEYAAYADKPSRGDAVVSPKDWLGSLRGSVLRYDAPFEPVADANEWDAVRD